MHPGIITTSEVQKEIINELESHQVRIIVISDMPQSNEENKSKESSGVKHLDQYIAQTFRTIDSAGPYRIMARKI
jgi:hypothetical protein